MGALGVFGAIARQINYAGASRNELLEDELAVFFRMMNALMKLAPLGAGGAMAFTIGRYGVAALRPLALLMGSFYLTCLLFILVVGFIYYFVPNAKVRFRDVWIGALVTGLLWKGTLEGFAWFVRDMSRFTRVNGSIAAVVVFLMWVYVQAVILLYGVEFTAAYARLRRGRPDSAGRTVATV